MWSPPFILGNATDEQLHTWRCANVQDKALDELGTSPGRYDTCVSGVQLPTELRPGVQLLGERRGGSGGHYHHTAAT